MQIFNMMHKFCLEKQICFVFIGSSHIYIYIDDILDWFLLDQESGFMCPSTNKNVFTK